MRASLFREERITAQDNIKMMMTGGRGRCRASGLHSLARGLGDEGGWVQRCLACILTCSDQQSAALAPLLAPPYRARARSQTKFNSAVSVPSPV